MEQPLCHKEKPQKPWEGRAALDEKRVLSLKTSFLNIIRFLVNGKFWLQKGKNPASCQGKGTDRATLTWAISRMIPSASPWPWGGLSESYIQILNSQAYREPPGSWHILSLAPAKILELSGCCLLGELLLGADLGNGCSLVSICPGTWHSMRTELSEPFGRKGASPDSLAQVQGHTSGCHSSPRTSSSSLQGHWAVQGSPRHFWRLMTGLVCTRREEKSVQWAEEAVAEDKHQSHMDQAQHTTLSVEKPKQNNHLSSLLQWY